MIYVFLLFRWSIFLFIVPIMIYVFLLFRWSTCFCCSYYDLRVFVVLMIYVFLLFRWSTCFYCSDDLRVFIVQMIYVFLLFRWSTCFCGSFDLHFDLHLWKIMIFNRFIIASRVGALVLWLKLPAWIVGDRGFHDLEVACSVSERQGSNFESAHPSQHSQEVLLTQFSLYARKCGLVPHSFHFFYCQSNTSPRIGSTDCHFFVPMFLIQVIQVTFPKTRSNVI